MSERILAVTSITGGVTQNPPETADQGRISDSLNMVPVPKSGLARRSPTEHRVQVQGNANRRAASKIIPVDLGGEDRYLASISHDNLKVFRRNGQEIVVRKVTRDSTGAITAGAAPDFAYLDFRAPNKLWNWNGVGFDKNMGEAFTSVAGKWINTGKAMAAASSLTVQSPLGWPANTLFPSADSYTELKLTAGSGSGTWRHFGFNSHLWSKLFGFSLRVNLDVPGAGTFVLPDDISLSIENPAGGGKHTVTWDLTGGASVLPVVSANTFNFLTFTERIETGKNEYVISFVWDPAKSTVPGSTSDVVYSYIDMSQGSATADPSGVYAWGGIVSESPPLDKPTPYAISPDDLRIVGAGATVFVSSPAIATRADTTVTTKTFAEAHPAITFTGTGGASASFDIADAGYVFIKLAKSNATYTVTVTLTDSVGAGGTKTLTASGTFGTGSQNTITEATNVASALNADGNNDDGTTRILEAVASGSVVSLQTKFNAGTSKWGIDSIEVADSEGDSLFSEYRDTVDDLSDLPEKGHAHGGHVIKLLEIDAPKDTFQVPQSVIRFVADGGTTGSFSSGRWIEGTDYSVRDTLDATTLPHKITRAFDDAAGTVTGKFNEPYFEWGEHTWDKRVVGGDIANPLPSFVTPEADEGTADRFVDAIGFFSNRLVIASGLELAMSEVSLFGNFWRSTLRVLPDSDRIDVTVSIAEAARIRDIGVAAGQLFLRTNRGLQIVTATGALSPKTIGVETVYGGGSDPVAQSVAASQGIFIPGDRGDNGGILFVFPQGQQQLTFQSIEATEDVPYLLQSGIHTMVWASALSSLFVHSRDDASKVFGLRFNTQNQGLAWFPLNFGGDPVHSMAVIAGELFLLIQREAGLNLESMRLDEIPRDAGQDWRVRLDRRLTDSDLTTARALSGSDTVITLPYSLATSRPYMVVSGASAGFGVRKTILSQTATTVTVEGDVTSDSLIMGETYESYMKPLKPVVRDQSQTDKIVRSNSIVLVREGAVAFSTTGEATVEMTDKRGRTTLGEFDAGDYQDAGTLLSSEDYRFVVASDDDDVDVKIKTSSQKPMTIVGLEWLLDVRDRVRGRNGRTFS